MRSAAVVVLAGLAALILVTLRLLAYQPAAPTPGTPSGPAAPSPSPSAAASPSPTTSESARNASIQWAFTGDHPDVLLGQDIASARNRVDVAMFTINRPAIIEVMAQAQQRCHCVRLITDRVQAATVPSQQQAMTTLARAGVPIKTDAHAGLMHLKMVQVDGRVVDEGSFNATNAASTINDEVLVRVASTEFAAAAAAHYDGMWNDATRFHDWQPGPDPSPSPAVLPPF